MSTQTGGYGGIDQPRGYSTSTYVSNSNSNSTNTRNDYITGVSGASAAFNYRANKIGMVKNDYMQI